MRLPYASLLSSGKSRPDICKIKLWQERRNNLASARLDSVSKVKIIAPDARTAMLKRRRTLRCEDGDVLKELPVVRPVSSSFGHMMRVEMLEINTGEIHHSPHPRQRLFKSTCVQLSIFLLINPP